MNKARRFSSECVLIFSALFAAYLCIAPGTAYAATKYWVGSAGGNVSTDSNWSTTASSTCGTNQNTTAPGSGDTAVFTGDCTNDALFDSTMTIGGLDMHDDYSGTATSTDSITLTVNGTFRQRGGTFGQPTGGEVIHAATPRLDLGGGTFVHNQATTTFSVSGIATTSGAALYDLLVKRSGSVTLSLGDNLTVDNDLALIENSCCSSPAILQGATGAGNPIITVAGNVYFEDPSTGGVEFGSATAANNIELRLAGDVTIDDSHILYYASTTFNGSGNQNIVFSSGNIAAGSSFLVNRTSESASTTVFFDNSGGGTWDIPLVIDAGTLMFASSADLNATFTQTGGTLEMPVSGEVTFNDDFDLQAGTFNHNSGTTTFDGTLTATTSGASFYNLRTDGGTITVSLADNAIVANNLSINSAACCSTNTLQGVSGVNPVATVSGDVYFTGTNGTRQLGSSSAATNIDLRVAGDFKSVDSTNTIYASTTFNGTSDQTFLFSSGNIASPFAILVDRVGESASTTLFIDDSGGGNLDRPITFDAGTLMFASSADLNATFTQTGGTLEMPVSGEVTFNDDFDLQAGTFNHNSGTTTFDGTLTATTSGATFYDVLLTKSGNLTVSLASDMSIANDLAVIQKSCCSVAVALEGVSNVFPEVIVSGNVYFQAASSGDADIGSTTAANNLALLLAGNITIDDSDLGVFASTTFNGTTEQLITFTAGTISTGDWFVNRPSENGTVVKLNSIFSPSIDVTIQQGTLYTDARTLSPSSITVEDGGILQMHGSETVTAPTFDTGSLARYVGTTTFTGLPAGDSYHHLTFAGVGGDWTLDAALDINGDLRIDAGTLVDGGNQITAGGNWYNNGSNTFTGTTTFDGTSQTISGTTTFFDFLKNASGGADTLTFASNSIQTMTGSTTMVGVSGNLLSLRASTTGTRAKIDPQGSRTVRFLDVKDSHNINATAISCSNGCVNSGNNVNWFFGATSISGTVYSDEGSTPLGSVTLRLAINGSDTSTTTDSAGDGTFTLSGVQRNDYDVITIYLEDETQDAVSVTYASTTNLAGIDLYQNNLLLYSSGVNSNGITAITNEQLATSTISGETDVTNILHDVTANILTVATNTTLYLPQSQTYVPGSATYVYDFDANGVTTLGSNGLFFSGSLEATTTDFTTSGTVTFTGTTTQTLVASSTAFTNLTLNGPGTLVLQDALDIDSALTITEGTLDLNGQNLDLTGATFVNTGTLQLDGGETLTSVTVSTDAGTTTYDGTGTYTELVGGDNYFNLKFNGTGSWTLDAALDTNGTTTVAAGTFIDGGNNVTVGGNWRSDGGTITLTGTTTFDGANQAFFGDTTFTDFLKSTTTADTLFFEAASTQTLTGSTTLSGANGQLLSLRSLTEGSQWKIDPQDTTARTIVFVDVKDSNNTNATAIDCTSNCTDSGNNTNWTFPAVSSGETSDGGDSTAGGGGTVAGIVGAVANPVISLLGTSPGNSTVTIERTDYRVGELIRVTVTAKGAFGIPIGKGGERVRVFVLGANTLEADVTDNGDGTYTASYFAVNPGKDEIRATINERLAGGTAGVVILTIAVGGGSAAFESFDSSEPSDASGRAPHAASPSAPSFASEERVFEDLRETFPDVGMPLAQDDEPHDRTDSRELQAARERGFAEGVLGALFPAQETFFTDTVVPVVAVVGILVAIVQAVAFTGNISGVADLGRYSLRLFGLFTSFGRHPEHSWGIVYDSETKRAIDPAHVTVYNQKEERVAEAITDLDGRYGFLLEPGTYTMRAEKTHYTFPSQKLSGAREDAVYDNLYFGESFTTTPNEVVTYNIPMDRQAFDWNEEVKRKEQMYRFKQRTSRLFTALFVAGFLFSLYALVRTPSLINSVTVGVYFALALFHLFWRRKHRATQLLDSVTNLPVAFGIIKAYIAGVDVLARKVVTDEHGYFYMLLTPQRYYFTVETRQPDGTYKEVHRTPAVSISGGVVKRNILV